MPTKGAAPIDYSKVFSSQVRKAFTGDENMNVAQGAYTMIRGSAPKNIDGTPMYGTISAAGTKQMKDKAAYKHGMHGDRNEMGKKAMNQKMGEYFPKQSRYLTQDGRAIDASRTKAAEMEEAGTMQTDDGYHYGRFSKKTLTDKKGREISLERTPNVRGKGTTNSYMVDGSSDPEAGFRAPLVMGSEQPSDIYHESGPTKVTEPIDDMNVSAKYTYTNKRGKKKQADISSRKGKRLHKKFMNKRAKFSDSGRDKSKRKENIHEEGHTKVFYNKGTYESVRS